MGNSLDDAFIVKNLVTNYFFSLWVKFPPMPFKFTMEKFKHIQ